MRNLRNQLLMSHGLLIVLMVVMVWAGIAVVMHLGSSIDRILKDNYDSVKAAQKMDDALERQQESALLMLLGQPDRARTQYDANWKSFVDAYQIEANNVTEPGEQEAVNDILTWSDQYRQVMKGFMAGPTGGQSQSTVFDTADPLFRKLKRRVQDVRIMNQDAIYDGDRRLREEARQASLAGVGACILAILLSGWLAWRSINHSLLPLHTLARQAEEIGAGHWNQRVELRRSDEVGVLAEAFNRMAAQLRASWNAEEQRRYVLERMANMALDSLQDAVLVVDGVGMVMHANRMAARLFAPVQEPLRTLSSLVGDPTVVQSLEQCLKGLEAPENAEQLALKREGERRVYRLRTRAIKDDDKVLGAVAVLEDVTHLQELDRLKTEFIGVASHELKTPVTSLLLSVQLLEEGAAGPLTPAQQEIVAAQRQDLVRLERTTRDLLDMTRLEGGGATDMVPVKAGELVAVAVDAVAAEARSRNVSLETRVVAEAGDVIVDRNQITRVLINLLTNAIRHAPGGRVEVAATRGPMGVTFAVRDDGSGIPPEYLPRIFERFVQVPGSTHGGSGLGLSIARSIVLAHHSDIQVDSVAGRGSTFRFTLSQDN